MSEPLTLDELYAGTNIVPSAAERQSRIEKSTFDAAIITLAVKALMSGNYKLLDDILLENSSFRDLIPDSIGEIRNDTEKTGVIIDFLMQPQIRAKLLTAESVLNKSHIPKGELKRAFQKCKGAIHKDLLEYFNAFLSKDICFIVSHGPKDKESTAEKVNAKYAGNTNKLKDLVRVTFVFENVADGDVFNVVHCKILEEKYGRAVTCDEERLSIEKAGYIGQKTVICINYNDTISTITELKRETVGQQDANILSHDIYELITHANAVLANPESKQQDFIELSIKLQKELVTLQTQARYYFDNAGDYIVAEQAELLEIASQYDLLSSNRSGLKNVTGNFLIDGLEGTVESLAKLHADLHLTGARRTAAKDPIFRKEMILLLERDFYKGKKQQALWREFYKQLLIMDNYKETEVYETIYNQFDRKYIENQLAQAKENPIQACKFIEEMEGFFRSGRRMEPHWGQYYNDLMEIVYKETLLPQKFATYLSCTLHLQQNTRSN